MDEQLRKDYSPSLFVFGIEINRMIRERSRLDELESMKDAYLRMEENLFNSGFVFLPESSQQSSCEPMSQEDYSQFEFSWLSHGTVQKLLCPQRGRNQSTVYRCAQNIFEQAQIDSSSLCNSLI